MLEEILVAINSWMQAGTALAALGCLLWGVAGVIFSPCHWMALPLIISYMAGQESELRPRQGLLYGLSFTLGVFLTIAAVGIACSLLGRVLGEVGPYWTILVGLVLLWVAFDMLGVVKCRLPSRFCKVKPVGLPGAFCIGLVYGIVSGPCTFGFIAPILALITVQQKIFTGVLLILFFGTGFSIPIAIAGTSAATGRRLVESSSFQIGGLLVRKLGGIGIGIVGVYFLARPFFL